MTLELLWLLILLSSLVVLRFTVGLILGIIIGLLIERKLLNRKGGKNAKTRDW